MFLLSKLVTFFNIDCFLSCVDYRFRCGHCGQPVPDLHILFNGTFVPYRFKPFSTPHCVSIIVYLVLTLALIPKRTIGTHNICFDQVVAWSLFYLFASFRGDVPWSHCGPALSSSSLCFSDQDFQACNRLGGVYNQLCFTGEFAQQTGIFVVPASLRVSSAEDYLNQ